MIPATGQWLEAVNLEQRRELAATPGAHSLSPNARAVHLFHYLARILNCNEQFIYVCRKVFQRQFSILLVHVAKTKGRHQREKTFSFGHCPNEVWGGVYPCPNFLALFLEVHFWSIKRVYFFKNANVLNF